MITHSDRRVVSSLHFFGPFVNKAGPLLTVTRVSRYCLFGLARNGFLTNSAPSTAAMARAVRRLAARSHVVPLVGVGDAVSPGGVGIMGRTMCEAYPLLRCRLTVGGEISAGVGALPWSASVTVTRMRCCLSKTLDVGSRSRTSSTGSPLGRSATSCEKLEW